MSYILDALKKSEQDRGNGSIPNVQTIHSSSLNYHQEKRLLWPWILIAILVINIFILIYFFKSEDNSQYISANQNIEKNNITPLQNEQIIENKPTPMPAPTTAATAIKPTAPQINSTPKPIANTAQTRVENKLKNIVDINELPANIRQQIPGMVFSAHVYSSAPLQRSLVINDRFMEEGSAVAQDLILVEITRNGAIFDFHGHRFSTGVLSGWSTH